MEYFVAVVKDVLGILYRTCGASLIMAVLAMGVYRQVKKSGMNQVIREWAEDFRENRMFRKQFFLVFYVCVMLFCTVLGKSILGNPLDNVLGVWGLHDGDGAVYIGNLEHLILFFPFILLLFQVQEEKAELRTKFIGAALGKSIRISFSAALAIELCQMFLKIGAFRISDLFFCTLGGALGGIVYWCRGRGLARIMDGIRSLAGWCRGLGRKLVTLAKFLRALVRKLIECIKKLGGWDTRPWKGVGESAAAAEKRTEPAASGEHPVSEKMPDVGTTESDVKATVVSKEKADSEESLVPEELSVTSTPENPEKNISEDPTSEEPIPNAPSSNQQMKTSA